MTPTASLRSTPTRMDAHICGHMQILSCSMIFMFYFCLFCFQLCEKSVKTEQQRRSAHSVFADTHVHSFSFLFMNEESHIFAKQEQTSACAFQQLGHGGLGWTLPLCSLLICSLYIWDFPWHKGRRNPVNLLVWSTTFNANPSLAAIGFPLKSIHYEKHFSTLTLRQQHMRAQLLNHLFLFMVFKAPAQSSLSLFLRYFCAGCFCSSWTKRSFILTLENISRLHVSSSRPGCSRFTSDSLSCS